MIFNEILVTMMSSDPKFFINCFFFSFLQGKVIGLYQSLFFFLIYIGFLLFQKYSKP